MNKDNVFFDFVNLNFYPEFVYFLGFCWADGWIYNSGYHNKICIEINSTDADYIKPYLEKVGIWKISKRLRNTQTILERNVTVKETTSFRISNKNLAEFLVKCGFKNKSGSYDKILSLIPENLHWHFYRGLIDGDGHISLCKTSQGYNSMSIVIAGPLEQDWSSIEFFCNKHTIRYRIRREQKEKRRCSTFIINRQKDLLKFINLLFKPEYNYLERKYSKAIEIATEILNKPKYSIP
jgi:hypothetical protein